MNEIWKNSRLYSISFIFFSLYFVCLNNFVQSFQTKKNLLIFFCLFGSIGLMEWQRKKKFFFFHLWTMMMMMMMIMTILRFVLFIHWWWWWSLNCPKMKQTMNIHRGKKIIKYHICFDWIWLNVVFLTCWFLSEINSVIIGCWSVGDSVEWNWFLAL